MARATIGLGSVAVLILIAYGASAASARSGMPSRIALAGRAPQESVSAGAILGFEDLKSYEYQPGLRGLPDRLKALDGATIRMRGVLLTLDEYDDTHDFVLVGSHISCCFGYPAGLSGQVHVVLPAGAQGLPNTSEPIEVVGTFQAREEVIDPDGGVLFIFRIRDASARIVGY